MWVKESITIYEKELLKIAEVKEADFSHERNQQYSTGIKAILRGFIDYDRKPVDDKTVANRVIKYLRDKGIIIGEKRCSYKFHPNHSWGAYDDDDCRPSVYSVSLEVYREEKVETV